MNERTILEMKGICKSFPGVKALNDICFTVKTGEIHCVVGENGAGKSTLMKILTGAYQKDEGEIFIEGEKVEIDSPAKGQELGIGIVYQELMLAPSLSVAENIFLGRTPVKRFGNFNTKIVDWEKLSIEARKILIKLNFPMDVRKLARDLTTAQKQMIEVAKAISMNAKIIILDEPTTSLTPSEIKELFKVLVALKNEGHAIIYISHKLQEIFEIGDRATVLKDGKYQGTVSLKEATKEQIIKMMVGREVGKDFPPKEHEIGEEILRVENLSIKGVLKDINFSLKKGEILGLAGLVGAGRTEIARAIFGADPSDSGEIYLNNKHVKINNPQDAVSLGFGFVTEDRKEQGLLLTQSVGHNITLSSLDRLSKLKVIDKNGEKKIIDYYVKQLSIKTPNEHQIALNLSGGNQQKVVLSKWLAKGCDIVIFDEPTKGIDVGSKEEFYYLISDLAKEGLGVIFISSELPEIIGMCDRVLVVRNGAIVKELGKAELTEEKIMTYAAGGVDSEYAV